MKISFLLLILVFSCGKSGGGGSSPTSSQNPLEPSCVSFSSEDSPTLTALKAHKARKCGMSESKIAKITGNL